MVYCFVSLPSSGKLPKEIRKDLGCYGAVEPKYGKLVEVDGRDNSKVKERLFFLLDVFESSPFHPKDELGQRLPRRFRLMNPVMLCKSFAKRSEHFSDTTTKKCIQTCGNIALVASGAFSKNQFQHAITYLRRRFGEAVNVIVIDGRKEKHWLGDLEEEGEPFSYHTMTNHQDSDLSCEEIIRQEEQFVNQGRTKIWARVKDDEVTPVFREYNSLQTERQFVTSIKNVVYHRLPITDHTALDIDTVGRLHNLVTEIFRNATKPNAPVSVIWTHCLGGKGRASSLSLATHVIIRRYLGCEKIRFKDLSKHIWLAGGRQLDSDPDPDKPYKYNGALCRRGVLEKIFSSYIANCDEKTIMSHVKKEIGLFVQEHEQEWRSQIDPTEFAEYDTDSEDKSEESD